MKTSAIRLILVGAVVHLFCTPGVSDVRAEHFDLLVVHGRIVDGTGNAWYYGDVGIKNGRIERIGDLSNSTARRTIDATDHVVSPGFIDIHSHGDLDVLDNPLTENYLQQGVTTICGGNCGHSLFPTDEYPTFADFSAKVERSGVSLNLICLIGHGPLRSYIMEDVRKPATGRELERMKELVGQLILEGASGMSTGLAFPPGIYSDTDEIVELCKVLAKHNALYATHIRGDAASWRPAIEEAIEISQRSGVALQISHLESHYPNWGAEDMALRLVEEARARGIEVTTDVPPYLRGGVGLETILPAEALDEGNDKIVEYLTNPDKRAMCKRYVYEEKETHNTPVPTLIADGHADNIFVEGVPLGKIARRKGLDDPADAAFDVLIENGGRIEVVLQHHYEPDLRKIVAHPLAMIVTDGKVQKFGEGMPNPRFYGAFPIVFRKYVRGETRPEAPEDPGMKVLPIEEAIRKMTSFPAQKLGLSDRGMIRESMIADLVIFNPKTIADKCTYANPHQYPVGIPYVVVNGEVVVDDSRHTGAMPGRILRSSRSWD